MPESTHTSENDCHGKECYLINVGISNCEDIENVENLTDITILNLHCNKLASLQGLPKFELLTELNLSSNEFHDVNVPELVHLPNLRSLDMSGNYIKNLDDLPYIPSIEVFSVAFNQISSLNGLDGFPYLQNLDIRGNSLEHVDSFASVQVLSSLRNMQLSSSDGRHANPICQDEAKVIEVFDSFFFLGTIDKKSRQEHTNLLTEKTFNFPGSFTPKQSATEPEFRRATEGSDNDNHRHKRRDDLTPNFDKAAERFRTRLKEREISIRDEVQSPIVAGIIGGVEVYEDSSGEEMEEGMTHISSPTSKATLPLSPSNSDRKALPTSSSNPWHEREDNTATRVKRLICQKHNNIAVDIGEKEEKAKEILNQNLVSVHENPPSYPQYTTLLLNFTNKISTVLSKNLCDQVYLRNVFELWMFKTLIEKKNEQITKHAETISTLKSQNLIMNSEITDAKAAAQTEVAEVKKLLAEERSRNSALQDRLIAMEQEHAQSIQNKCDELQVLTTQLSLQKDLTTEVESKLSQQEKKYGQTLEEITTDVMKFTKLMEGKDEAINSLQANKSSLESEIKQLRGEISDLTNARDQFECQDCLKMKSFFETMQHDMQQCLERKVLLEHENSRIPELTKEVSNLKEKLVKSQLDFTKQVSEMQQLTNDSISKEVLSDLETKHAKEIQHKEEELAEKELKLQQSLIDLKSAKDALMEYDDKCLEMEKLLKDASARIAKSADMESELQRCNLDIKKQNFDIKKKDQLVSEMREHVLEVKSMLKKLADKCRSLEYVNSSQKDDLEEAKTEIKRLEEELSNAHEVNRSLDLQHCDIGSSSILSKKSTSSAESGSPITGKQRVEQPANNFESSKANHDFKDVQQDEVEDSNMVSRQIFDDLLNDFEQLQAEHEEQSERVALLEGQLQDVEDELNELKSKRMNDGDLRLSVGNIDMTPQDLREVYLKQKEEHEQAMKDMSVSLRIKEKMIDDQNNAIRCMKERHREDEVRVQETITVLEEENEDLRNELSVLEEQLEQSREQEKRCVRELHSMEENRTEYQKQCKKLADEEIEPYRVAIGEKDDALERARQELSSICDVVADMKAKGAKKDNEIKQLKKEMQILGEEVSKEAEKYRQEKASKAKIYKDVQKMRSEISHSLINKENIIKDLKKSLKSKKILLIESHEKILHMEQLFGTFQQLAANISATQSKHMPPQQVSLTQGKYSVPVPSHLLLNERALAQTMEKYSDASRSLKESISDMSVISSDSENETHQKNKPLPHDENNIFTNNVQNKKQKRPSTISSRRKKSVTPVKYKNKAPVEVSSPPRRDQSRQHFSEVEISLSNSANILELSNNDDSTVELVSGQEETNMVDEATRDEAPSPSYHDQFYEKYSNDL